MTRRIVLAIACVSTTGLARAADDLEKLEGTWVPQSADIAGKVMPKEALTFKLEIKGSDYTVTAESDDKGTVTLDEKADPKAMDIKGVEGPNKGKTFLAIYELKDDELRVCYDLSEKSRPKEFKSRPKSLDFFVVYKRQRSEK